VTRQHTRRPIWNASQPVHDCHTRDLLQATLSTASRELGHLGLFHRRPSLVYILSVEEKKSAYFRKPLLPMMDIGSLHQPFFSGLMV